MRLCRLSGTMIGHLVQIHLYADNFSQAWYVMVQFLRKNAIAQKIRILYFY